MTWLMNELHKDHQHISNLLTIIKNTLAVTGKGSPPNIQLMKEFVDYLIDYSDCHHHARENLLYQFLMSRNPKMTQLIRRQMQDHQDLRQLTTDMRAAIDRALENTPSAADDFVQQLGVFIDQQMKHMTVEELRLYPHIEQTMKASDWSLVEAQLSPNESSDFAKRKEQRYQSLCNALIDDLA